MNRALCLLFTLLCCGCFGFQHRVSAQSREEALPSEAEMTGLPNSTPKVSLNATFKSPALTLVTVERVSFEGLQSLSEADVLHAFREQRVAVKAQSPFDASAVKKGVEIIRQMLEEQGYFKAKVEVSVEDISAESKAVKFIVNEGQPVYIKEIQFKGNRVFTNDELRSQLKYVTAPEQDAFDRTLLQYELNNVRNYMRSRGYLQATMEKPQEQLVEDGISITVQVHEGLLYRVGHITIEGAKLFSPEQVIEMIGLRPGDIADGRAISDALFKKIRQFYVNAGYIQYEADTNPEYSVNEKTHQGILDLTIEIREGQAFKISSIEFAGNKRFSTEQLRRSLLIHEGEVFNEQMFAQSINNLNNVMLLEEVDKERDVEFQKDEDAGLVKLIIKVREIPEEETP